MKFLSHIACLVATVAQCHAHMILKYPPPIGNPNNSPLNNAQRNPAATGGGSYPCKVQSPADYQSAEITNLQAGSSIPVSFLGSAVHGGGSCQFALSKDIAPTVESKFKVIHSVEGGCPARNQPGNFPEDDPNFADPDTYSVTLPDELQSGRYTFSWTWVNKIGNREFYMNCAAVQIGSGNSGSGNVAHQASTTNGDDPFFDSLPDMVVLNTDTDDCVGTNPEGAFLYANPGTSVETNEQNIPQANMILPQCAAGGGKITQAARSAPPPSDTNPSSTSSSVPDILTPTPNLSPSSPMFSFSPVSTFASGTAAPIPDPVDSTSSSTTSTFASRTRSRFTSAFGSPTPAPIGQPPSSPPSLISCAAPTIQCTTLGFTCVDSNTFVLCGHVGDCAVPQSMAAGTICDNNGIGSGGSGGSDSGSSSTTTTASSVVAITTPAAVTTTTASVTSLSTSTMSGTATTATSSVIADTDLVNARRWKNRHYAYRHANLGYASEWQ